ncbi:MAG: DUF378 domain-containing protein [Phycisphaerae bacterium]|nr:DUF378 domain-containing protein [Phycisphaerae bacterium]
MLRLNTLGWASLIILLIGGINWGLIGFFDFNLVAALFGTMTPLSRIIYALVGLSALYVLGDWAFSSKETHTRAERVHTA